MADRSRLRPGKPHVRGGEQKRARIAAEAARIMADEGVRDFHTAKRKAAERMNVPQLRDLPTNQEVDAALAERLNLFHREAVAQQVRYLREIAVEAMGFLASYHPRLVGSVLSGNVTSTSVIQLHVAADSPDDIGLFLREHEIPFELRERRYKFGGERYENVVSYSFVAKDANVELLVFDPRSREPPLSPVDRQPMQRAPLQAVKALLRE